MSADDLAATRRIGEQVQRILTRAGLPTSYQPDFRRPPADSPGARVAIDPTAAGQVYVSWRSSAELVSASIDESRDGDFTGAAVRLHVTVVGAMGEAMVAILQAAGFAAGLGVDMDPAAVWVRPRASAG